MNDLVRVLGLAQPQVSKHLRVLREVGAVDVRDEGRQRLYRVNGQRAQAHPRLGEELRALVVGAVRRAGRVLEELKQKEEGDDDDDE